MLRWDLYASIPGATGTQSAVGNSAVALVLSQMDRGTAQIVPGILIFRIGFLLQKTIRIKMRMIQEMVKVGLRGSIGSHLGIVASMPRLIQMQHHLGDQEVVRSSTSLS